MDSRPRSLVGIEADENHMKGANKKKGWDEVSRRAQSETTPENINWTAPQSWMTLQIRRTSTLRPAGEQPKWLQRVLNINDQEVLYDRGIHHLSYSYTICGTLSDR